MKYVLESQLHRKKKKKIKNRATIRSSYPTLGIYTKNIKTLIRKDICTPMLFTAALFTTAKIWKQLKCPLMDD